MPHARVSEPLAAGPAGSRTDFEITALNAAAGILQGTGDPALDADGLPGRAIYVDILDPVSGHTWFGATRRWAKTQDLWHWSLDLSLAAGTAEQDQGFGRVAGTFEIVAYFEERDPATGHVRTVQTAPFTVTVRDRKAEAATRSVPEVLARLRALGQHARPGQPTARTAADPTPRGGDAPDGRVVFTK